MSVCKAGDPINLEFLALVVFFCFVSLQLLFSFGRNNHILDSLVYFCCLFG